MGDDGGDPGAGAAVRAVERTAHRRELVWPDGAGRHPRRAGGPGQRRPALPCSGPSAAPQASPGAVSPASPRGALRARLRPSSLRRDEHVLRGTEQRQPDGPAGTQPRPSSRLQAGVHCPGRHARGDSSGLRAIRRQPGRRHDGGGDRRIDGGPIRPCEASLGHGPGDGQPGERVVASAHGSAVRPWGFAHGAEAVEAGADERGGLEERARRGGGQTPHGTRWQRSLHPLPVGGADREGEGDARALRQADRRRSREPGAASALGAASARSQPAGSSDRSSAGSQQPGRRPLRGESPRRR